MDTRHLRAGDRVYRYVWTGGEEHQPQPLTVVSTPIPGMKIKVRTDQGSEFRVYPGDIVDFWTYDEGEQK